jgi:putative nucleotidyltransferase with HDIG domain
MLALPLLWAVVAVIGCTWLLVPGGGGQVPTWEPGALATFDVVVPRDMSLPDEAATEAVREEARSAVLPVYDLEPRLSRELIDEVQLLFVNCRLTRDAEDGDVIALDRLPQLIVAEPMHAIIGSSECSEELETALVEVISQVYRVMVVDDGHALERRGEGGVVVRNLVTTTERPVPLVELPGIIDSRSGLAAALRPRLLEQEVVARRWIKPILEFLEANMVPNLVFNRAETAQRIETAAAEVTPRSQVFRRGQVLVRRGDTVTQVVSRTLGVMSSSREELTLYTTLVGIGLLMVLMMVGWWHILGRFGGEVDRRKWLSIVFVLVILFTALNRVGVVVATAVAANSQGPAWSSADAYLWGLPCAAGPAAVVLLLGIQPAVLFALCGALLAGLMLGGDFSFMVFALASGLTGAVATQSFKGRTALSRAGLVVGAANLVVLLVLELHRGFPDPPAKTALAAGCALIGGPLAVGIASALLPMFEGLFSLTTDIRLLELSNQNLPLLKRLSLQAPGTYQHSLAVGNLAEAGAVAVGANGLLLRVCAYYHDIGKLVKPDYFVENQRGINPHDSLSPSMSALVIQSHVKQGLALAREANLPLPVRQAIATHHGTKLIRYFYSRAQERSDPGKVKVQESDYRYPGPRPHTKELGILLLADAIEAAARTLDNPSPTKIQNMIGRIFTDTLEDGQLDQSELTFSELDKIGSAFLWVLTNMYHHRIDYPGFDFNRRQSKRDSGAHHLGTKAVSASG